MIEPPPPLDHGGPEPDREHEERAEVDGDDEVQVGLLQILGSASDGHAGVVHKHVHPARRGQNRLGETRARSRGGEVGREDERVVPELGGNPLEVGDGAPGQDHPGARRIEGPGNPLADAAARSGHERRLRCENGHAVFPPESSTYQGRRQPSPLATRTADGERRNSVAVPASTICPYPNIAKALSSMLSRGAESVPWFGSSKAVWAE